MSTQTHRGTEFWAAVVAEVQKGDLPRVQVAAKHGVSDAALKYHLYPGERRSRSYAECVQANLRLASTPAMGHSVAAPPAGSLVPGETGGSGSLGGRWRHLRATTGR